MQKSPPGCTPIRLPIKKHPKLSNSSRTRPRGNPRQVQTKPTTIQHPDRSSLSPPRLKAAGRKGKTQHDQPGPDAPIRFTAQPQITPKT